MKVLNLMLLILSPKGEEECDASDTTSGGFSSASSCEEHGSGDTTVLYWICTKMTTYWAFDRSSRQESDGEPDADVVDNFSGSTIATSNPSVDPAADEEKEQVGEAEGLVGAAAGSNANMLHKSK